MVWSCCIVHWRWTLMHITRRNSLRKSWLRDLEVFVAAAPRFSLCASPRSTRGLGPSRALCRRHFQNHLSRAPSTSDFQPCPQRASHWIVLFILHQKRFGDVYTDLLVGHFCFFYFLFWRPCVEFALSFAYFGLD